ncbi:MAG TPA: hypothetical protein VL240_01155 [Candidatus Binatia bacterium]|nr:hypothetical protein [Candidatus Binatia bacterium]
MFKSFNRLSIIAALAVATLAADAVAQSRPAVPPTLGPVITQPGNGASTESLSGKPTPQWVVGWNYMHLAKCNMYESGGYAYLNMYPLEGGILWTNDSNFIHLLAPACQTGNWIGFYMYDFAHDWSQILTYDYY